MSPIQRLLDMPGGLEKMASAMTQPIRCGGSGYGAQGRYLIRGGVPYYGPESDYHDPADTIDLNRRHGFTSPCEVYLEMQKTRRGLQP
jgi:hypothetical protein